VNTGARVGASLAVRTLATLRRKVLAKLAGMHRRELQRLGPIFRRFFAEISG
jgi:hypothetical protein